MRSLPEECGGNDPVPSVLEVGDDSPLMGFVNKVRMKRKCGLEPIPEDPIDDSSVAPKTTQQDISGTAKGDKRDIWPCVCKKLCFPCCFDCVLPRSCNCYNGMYL